MKLRIRCASISYVNGSKSEDRSDNQSNKSAVLGLFTHEGREKLLTARTGKGHSISYSRLLKPTKPFSTAIYRSSRWGGGTPHARACRRWRPIETVGKIFTVETTDRFFRFSRFLTLRRKNCFTYKKKVKKEEGNKR